MLVVVPSLSSFVFSSRPTLFSAVYIAACSAQIATFCLSENGTSCHFLSVRKWYKLPFSVCLKMVQVATFCLSENGTSCHFLTGVYSRSRHTIVLEFL